METHEISHAMNKAAIEAVYSGKPTAILSDRHHADIYLDSLQPSQRVQVTTDDGYEFYGLGKALTIKVDDNIKGMNFVDSHGKILASV